MNFRKVVLVTVVTILMVTMFSTGVVAQQSEGYAGSHVSFETADNAIVDYQVDGVEIFSSASVEAKSNAESRGAAGLGAGLNAGLELDSVSGLVGARISASTEARTSAQVDFEGSTGLEAHDNPKGVVILRAGGEEQLVEIEVPAEAQANADSESVVSFNSDEAEASVIVVGEGEVAVNDEGNAVAHLGSDSRVVVRSHIGGADDDDMEQDRMISDGKVAAEAQFVYGDRDEIDAATYLEGTEAEARQTSESVVEVSVERGESDGKVVLITVSRDAIGEADDFEVKVDGDAAAEVDSYSELEAGLTGDKSRFMVVGNTRAMASADVLVAVEGFSERTVEVSSEEEDGEMNVSEEENEESEGLPGFGALVALVSGGLAVLYLKR